MKLTKWFPADMKPKHVGVYETRSPVLGYGPGWFSYWNGSFWCHSCLDKNNAVFLKYSVATRQDRPWRGLAEKPE